MDSLTLTDLAVISYAVEMMAKAKDAESRAESAKGREGSAAIDRSTATKLWDALEKIEALRGDEIARLADM